MDKDFLEKILKSGITVQGDLVMEKHVENEIGNVEAGGHRHTDCARFF